jgi:hypothetical protein
MNKIKDKLIFSPILIILLIFLLPPLGLILLGNHPRLSLFAKISSACIVSIFLLLFFFQYQFTPRLPADSLKKTETLQYELISIEYPKELQNSIDKLTEAKQDHHFVQVFFSVENMGEKSIFYASLIDQPQLIGTEETFMPDLTLSREPFGSLGSKKKAEGYLVFVIPIEAKLQRFVIADQEFSLLP